MTLVSLNQSIASLSLEAEDLKEERVALEQKVQMLRPGSISKDLLEERARIVLGYKYKDEVSILYN